MAFIFDRVKALFQNLLASNKEKKSSFRIFVQSLKENTILDFH